MVVALAETEDLRAPRATNRRKDTTFVHAPAVTDALMNLPARAPSGTFALPASTRGTRARGCNPGPSSFAIRDDRLREAANPGHFPAYTSALRFLRIPAIVNTVPLNAA